MTTKTLAYAAVALAALTLSGCGGDGGGDAAGLEFLGSVGGDWLQDGDAAQPGLQLRRTGEAHAQAPGQLPLAAMGRLPLPGGRVDPLAGYCCGDVETIIKRLSSLFRH